MPLLNLRVVDVAVSNSAPAINGTEPAPAVVARGLTRRFGDVVALDHVDLMIRKGEFFSLLGPSGCGKTTLLRMIAGLDHPDEGTLEIGGVDARTMPAHRRPVNTVFQSYALFPHMTVRENVAFGLVMKKVPRPEIEERVKRVMAMVEIEPLAQRKPAQLSGGQRQRVALARAIVNEPQVLLLDEPLGALDLKLRRQLQQELHRLQKSLRITFVYVTHDQEEALALSDRIAVMNHGRIEQLGTAEDLYERPRTRYTAQFVGSCNLLEGTLHGTSGNKWCVRTPSGDFVVQTDPATLAEGKKATLVIRPEKIRLQCLNGELEENSVKARIMDTTYNGAETVYLLKAGDWEFKSCLLNLHGSNPAFKEGENVMATLPPSGLVMLAD